MTGIERHFKEEHIKRRAEFQRRLIALREEFSDLNLLYVEPVGPADVIEIYRDPGELIEVRKPIRRTRWSWK